MLSCDFVESENEEFSYRFLEFVCVLVTFDGEREERRSKAS